MLQGTRVVDMSRVLAGPLCGMILGDLGADVLKVERTATGDETRAWGPPFDDRGEAAYYLSVNRNKLGITVDLDEDADRERLVRLIRDADVVIDNFRAGTLERRGIDPGTLLCESPRLIWCTLSGFGALSPRPGYDYVVQAEAGWMWVTGEAQGEPMKSGIALADVIAGKDAAIAVLAALAARAAREGRRYRAGGGGDGEAGLAPEQRRLHVSLAASATAALVNVAQNALVSGVEARRWGNAHPNLVPYQLFSAADRPLVVAVGNDGQWQGCCRAFGLHELAADRAVASNEGRLAMRDRIVAAIAERVARAPASHWIERLEAEGVPCGVVRSVREALADVATSPLTGVAPSIPGTIRRPPPTLGEHDAVVRTHGWEAFAVTGTLP